ncbi:hypothetical protein ANCCAN_28289 [Ancylostoma caninum]|uniref:Unspecific monooxygenase n=1 Tax=Ancylostoma caninum TaxID=29170 RepID=A0A368F1N9_ANCCA|nr:hypothetical protein ANCCAN_28289 [Ancylostoma caninum]
MIRHLVGWDSRYGGWGKWRNVRRKYMKSSTAYSVCEFGLFAQDGDSDRLPTPEDLKQMVYLEKCIKESLRLTPSVPLIARKLSEDVVVGETTLPKGLTVVVVPVTTARDPRYWERPEDFYPEHFDADKVAGRDPYSYIPFSAGPRNCIGQKFALLEEKAVLSWIFRRYHVETKDPFPENRPIPELILRPSNGVRVKLTKR